MKKVFLILTVIATTLAQPDSPIGSRPIVVTPTTPINTEAASKDYPTGLGSVIKNLTTPFGQPLVGLIYTPKECMSIKPEYMTDCGMGTTKTMPCCYMIPVISGDSICYPISFSDYITNSSPFNISNTLYYANCDTKLKKVMDICGESNPISASDCTKDSILDNSCCLFHTPDSNHCFWYGSVAPEISNTTLINCKSNFVNFENINFFLFFLITLLFLYN